MDSLLLTIAARALLPLLAVFGFFMLLSGHDAPGGGFAGGLVLTTALALHLFGTPSAGERELARMRPSTLIGAGLLVMVASGLVGLLGGEPFLSSMRLPGKVPLVGGLHLGTELLFDLGVAVASAGAVAALLIALEARSPWKS